MNDEQKYRVEFGKQVEKYLKKSGLNPNDFAQCIKSNINNVNDIIAGKVGLTLSKMITIASLFGQTYYDFANPNFPIPLKSELTKNIKNVLARRKSIGTKEIDKTRVFASTIDNLISKGHFNTPTTSKLTLAAMGEEFKDKKPSEVTSLLSRPPRNENIKSIGKIGTQHIYIHVKHVAKFEKLSKEDLIKLIKDKEANLTSDKE